MSKKPRKIFISSVELKNIEERRPTLIELLDVNFGPHIREGTEGRYSYRFDSTMSQIAEALDIDPSLISRYLRYPDVYDSNQPRANGFEITMAKARIYNACVKRMREECEERLESSIYQLKHTFTHAQIIQRSDQLQWILEKFSDDIITEFIRDMVWRYDDITLQNVVLGMKLESAYSQSLRRMEKLNFVLDNNKTLADALRKIWPIEYLKNSLINDQLLEILAGKNMSRELVLDYLNAKQKSEISKAIEKIQSLLKQ